MAELSLNPGLLRLLLLPFLLLLVLSPSPSALHFSADKVFIHVAVPSRGIRAMQPCLICICPLLLQCILGSSSELWELASFWQTSSGPKEINTSLRFLFALKFQPQASIISLFLTPSISKESYRNTPASGFFLWKLSKCSGHRGFSPHKEEERKSRVCKNHALGTEPAAKTRRSLVLL